MAMREARAWASIAVRNLAMAAAEIAEGLASPAPEVMLAKLKDARKTAAAADDRLLRAILAAETTDGE